MDASNGEAHGSPFTVHGRLRAVPVQLIATDDAVVVARGATSFKVAGSGAAQVVEVILTATRGDEGIDAGELRALFAAPQRTAIDSLLGELVRRGIVSTDDDTVPVVEGRDPANQEVFYWNFGARAEAVRGRLAERRVVVLGVNCISRRLTTELLDAGFQDITVVDHPHARNLGLFDGTGTLEPGQWPADLDPPVDFGSFEALLDSEPGLDHLVATSDFGAVEVLRECNRQAVRRGVAFLPVVLRRLVGYLGPMVVPGDSPCYECAWARENANVLNPEMHRVREFAAEGGQAIEGFHPSMATMLGALAAIELTKFYSDAMLSGVGIVSEVKMLQPSVEGRQVLKVPRCPVCSPMQRLTSLNLSRFDFFPHEQFIPGGARDRGAQA